MAVFHLEDLFDALDLAGEDAIECGAVAWPKLSCILNTGEAEHAGFQQPLSIAILKARILPHGVDELARNELFLLPRKVLGILKFYDRRGIIGHSFL